MAQTITRVYGSYDKAREVVQSLKSAGVDDDDISLIANEGRGGSASTSGRADDAGDGAAEGAGSGATIGGVLGGGAGLLTGLGVMAIPGVGPVVAAGWLAATAVGALAGAATGAAAGGIIGALTGSGVPEEDAQVYAESVKRGGSLVSVRVGDDRYDEALRIMDGHAPYDVAERRTAWREEGWTGFDDRADAKRAMPSTTTVIRPAGDGGTTTETRRDAAPGVRNDPGPTGYTS